VVSSSLPRSPPASRAAAASQIAVAAWKAQLIARASLALLESGNLEAILGATRPRVVIVGGGFGGLFATRELAGAPVSVTLVDKRNYHLFRPMLYQVATGLLSADQIAGPLRSILNRQQNVEVLLDEVSGIDTEKRLVHFESARGAVRLSRARNWNSIQLL
jgi:NADPH-dependent 2,4-dienoyl-CoA reductase/sulfur reductase-like enzyme